ncbi:MAG: hypothetical protein CVU44_09005 [Chloroflexi bacterium HGW-Chloroflexi-6]|nr:MAG: hypothetical protein CVU44_09005 [Chloroflexi bacterium HGW-Chloroflexi-6]
MEHAEIVAEMDRIVTAARAEQIHLRVIGGLAVHYHSQRVRGHAFVRDYADIDFVVRKHDRRKLEPFFKNFGYVGDRNFNLVNGDRRLLYIHPLTGRHIDIFVGDFEMCHKLPLRDRLDAHPVTVPLAELLLSKTQIVQLNRKDALDLIALLLDNELSFHDETKINLDRILRLCKRDWGLYKTTSINLKRLEEILLHENPGLSEEDTKIVLNRIGHLRKALQSMPTDILWKARDRVGTRLRWYTEVEEIER